MTKATTTLTRAAWEAGPIRLADFCPLTDADALGYFNHAMQVKLLYRVVFTADLAFFDHYML